MKKLPKFNQKSLEKLESHKLSNIHTVYGGWVCASTWSGGGKSGTDSVTDSTRETSFEGTGDDHQCHYWDITFSSPSSVARQVSMESGNYSL